MLQRDSSVKIVPGFACARRRVLCETPQSFLTFTSKVRGSRRSIRTCRISGELSALIPRLSGKRSTPISDTEGTDDSSDKDTTHKDTTHQDTTHRNRNGTFPFSIFSRSATPTECPSNPCSPAKSARLWSRSSPSIRLASSASAGLDRISSAWVCQATMSKPGRQYR